MAPTVAPTQTPTTASTVAPTTVAAVTTSSNTEAGKVETGENRAIIPVLVSLLGASSCLTAIISRKRKENK